MMSIDTLYLSVVQGISEILPISSSVNLHFLSHIYHIGNFSFSIKVALHAGSLITLLVYYSKEILDMMCAIFGRKKIYDTYLIPLVLGTVPVVLFGYLARGFVKEFDSAKVMGIASIIFGILLYICDKFSISRKTHVKAGSCVVSPIKSLMIGFCQAIAIFPGVSRLGICITSARMLGMPRPDAINFSLMLAIPSILGSLCLEIYNCKHIAAFYSTATLSAIGITALVGLMAIVPCMRLMTRHGFGVLSIYRVIIGLLMCFL